MREILIYTFVALSGLFILGYSVHMFVGGLVSSETEFAIIAAACLVGAAVIGYMVWDVIKRRSGR